MVKNFYSAFIDRHRGPRELIKSRLRVYLPFLQPLKKVYPGCEALDLGCGRGEWLELMAEQGFRPHGVDLDEAMLSECEERDLPASKQDAVEALRALPNESKVIVSGFHLAEHLPFERLQVLVEHALRVLKPAGLLILETPNPENLAVAAVGFHMDPTHHRPLPPALLSFLTAHYGFARNKVVRLQESCEVRESKKARLLDVLSGVSPDFAVISQKPAPGETFNLFNEVFEKDYGLTMEALSNRFEDEMQSRLSQIDAAQEEVTGAQTALAVTEARSQWLEQQAIEAKVQIERLASESGRAKAEAAHREARLAENSEALMKARQALAQKNEQLIKTQQALAEQQRQTSTLQNRTIEAHDRIAELERSVQHWRSLAENFDQQIQAIYKSRSWRITGPYRSTGNFVRRVSSLSRDGVRRLGTAIESLLRSLLLAIMRAVYRRPRLNDWLKQRLERYPNLWERLALQARDAGLFAERKTSSAAGEGAGSSRQSRYHRKPNTEVSAGEEQGNFSQRAENAPQEDVKVLHLSPRARRVYLDLKKSIERRKREAG